MAGSVNSIPGKGDPAGAHKLWNFERATLARDARRCQPTQGDSKASVAERRFTARIQACTIGILLQRVAFRGDCCSCFLLRRLAAVHVGDAKVVATLLLPGASYTSWSLRLRTSARTSTRLAPMANGSTPRTWNGGSGIRCLNSITQRPESLRFEP